MANPYDINFSNIPFSNAGGAMLGGLGGTPQQAMSALGPAYQNSYNAALGFNQKLGETINSGYNQAMTNQLGGQQGIMDTIANYGQSAKQGITDAAAQQTGAADQSLIGRGLGNFTVMDAAHRGINYDAGKQNLQLQDQIAGMKAGYQNQAIGQNTNLAQDQLHFLNSMSGNYPNAGLYGQLASQYGAAGQSAANQAAYNKQLDAMKTAGQGGGGAMGAIGGGGGGARQSPFGAMPGTANGGGYSATPTGGGFAMNQATGGYGGAVAGVGAGAYGSGFLGGVGQQMANGMMAGQENPYAGGFYDYGTPFDAGTGVGTSYPDAAGYGKGGYGPPADDSGGGGFFAGIGQQVDQNSYTPFMDEWNY